MGMIPNRGAPSLERTMKETGYEPDGVVLAAGGIPEYTDGKINQQRGVSVTLDPAHWDGNAPYTQTIHIEWMTADWIAGCPTLNVDACSSDIAEIIRRKEEFAKLGMIVSSDGALTFTAFEEKPETSLDLDIPSSIRRG